MIPDFHKFIPGDKFIVKFAVHTERLEVQKSLEYFGFTRDSVSYPSQLSPSTYKSVGQNSYKAEYLVSISTEAELRSLLAFLKYQAKLDEVENVLDKIFVSPYVHSRNEVSVN